MGAMLGPIAVGPLLPKLYYAIGLPNVFLLMACFILVFNGVGGLLLLPVPSKPADSSSSDSSSDSRISMLTVARDRRVLLIGMCCLFGSLGSWVPVVHIVRLAMDRGIDEASASSLLMRLSKRCTSGVCSTCALALDRMPRSRQMRWNVGPCAGSSAT